MTAITQYQIDNGLPVTGVIDGDLLASLFPGSAGAAGAPATAPSARA